MTGGFALAAILAALIPSQTQDETYAWPLQLPRELTSSFGEYRPGRYHMGIDLRTGPIGKDVFAAADGYVSRIRCSPYGYGKAVYLQLDDGNSAVYAHLSDFAPALRDFVRRAQHEREEYTVDLTPKPGEFRVKKGELIAKSGQTGIGVPHLHYELRDKDGVPINPRLLGVTWPDKTPPEFKTVSIVPLTAETRVNGRFEPATLTLTRKGSEFVSPGVTVEGSVGFAVEVTDPSAGSRLGIRGVNVTAGDESVFRLVNDRLSYDHAEDGAIAFAPFESVGRPLALWRAHGNDAEPYDQSAANGQFTMPANDTTVRIMAEDFHGNASTLSMPLRAGTRDEKPVAKQEFRGLGDVTFKTSGNFLIATTIFPQNEPAAPVLVFGGDADRIPLERIGQKTFQLAFFPRSGFRDALVNVEHEHLSQPGRRWVFIQRGVAAHTIVERELKIAVQSESPYGNLVFGLFPAATENDQALTPVDSAFDIAPGDTPVDAPITLSLPVPASEHPERAQIYRRDVEKKKWIRQDTKLEGGRASATTRRLGTYALLLDNKAPTVEVPDIAPNQTIASRRPLIRARILDEGSGIESWRTTFNGKWMLVGYDPEQDLLAWEQDEDLASGAGTLVVEVRDYAGNTTRREIHFTVAPK